MEYVLKVLNVPTGTNHPSSTKICLVISKAPFVDQNPGTLLVKYLQKCQTIEVFELTDSLPNTVDRLYDIIRIKILLQLFRP